MKNTVPTLFLELMTFLAIFFVEIQAALLSIGFLIMADSFTAIWATISHNGWDSVTSRKAGRIITKLILYPLAIIVAKVAQEYLAPSIPWIDVTAGIIATIEVKSIFENMSLLLGYDLWKRVKETLWKARVDGDTK